MQRYPQMKMKGSIYYGESDSIKGEDTRYYVSAADIIKGRVGKERLQGKLEFLERQQLVLKI